MLTSRSDLSPVLSNPSLTCFKSFSSPHPASHPTVQLLSYTYRASCKRSNIVGQQLPTLLNIPCCVRLHTLLHVVGSCSAKFNTGQTFSYVQTDPTTPNIGRPTMLGVVGSVCTWLLSTDMITQCSPGAPCIGSCTSFTFLKPI